MTQPNTLQQMAPPPSTSTAARVAAGRHRRHRRHLIGALSVAVIVVAVFAATLMIGRSVTPPSEVIRVLLGENVPGASFTVGELRLPRATTGLLAGFAFGAAGVTFQTVLRNPLASPDIIGISSGAGAFAVLGIIVFGLGDTAVSFLALVGALATAATIYLLSSRGGFAGVRFILIGVGLAAMLTSVTSYVLSRASNWEIQTAMQWLAGSLNSAGWAHLTPLALASLVLIPIMIIAARDAGPLRLGDDLAFALGVSVQRSRLTLILCAVGLLAFATAVTGPIAFVAFMAGPIAARVSGHSGGMPLVTAGLTGSVLVMASDLVGQFLFDERYPVGVITGVLGAPFLLILLIRLNRTGSAL